MAAAVAQMNLSAQEGSIMSAGLSQGTSGTSHSQISTSNLQALASQQYQPYYLRPGYRFKTNMQSNSLDVGADGPGRRLRKNVANVRRHIDYVANVLNHAESRLWQYGTHDRQSAQPDILYQNSAELPAAVLDKTIDCVLNKFVRAAMNKVKCPIYSICWTPEGKRLITGASTGEFTLWNGTAFNFETILQAHDSAIRALKWSHNDQWLVSADHDGFVKYWQPNMNNVLMYQAHKDEPVRSLSFSPTDLKLVTGSDDGTARIWDFARFAEEKVLRGHGSDVRSVDWHPQKGLICTGSRDSQQPVKLWDPKTGQCLSTLHDHKNSVMAVQWNRNGNWLLTASRDHLIKLYDIRMMREMHTYRGHKKEVTAVAWHPVHESLFVSGGGDGSLAYWLVNSEKELGFLEHAHDQAIWTLEWHPLGHILASGSNDNNTKFWARNRPGDTQEDIFGLASFSGVPAHSNAKELKHDSSSEETTFAPVIPGMGLDDDVFQGIQNRETRTTVGGPPVGGPLLFPEDPNARQQSANIGAKRTLIKQPPPKRAQRQFERMWNVAKPSGGDDFDDEIPNQSTFRRSKASLLGPPPRSLLSTRQDSEQRTRSPELEHKSESSQSMQQHIPPPNMMQHWQPEAANPQQINMQQMNPQPGSMLNPTHPMSQMSLGAIRLPTVSVPAAGGQLMWPPPLPGTIPSVGSAPQNRDIDYRMNASVMPIPPQVPSASTSSDVDLRNSVGSLQSQSWRTSDSNLAGNEETIFSGEMRIHDPRMRRKGAISSPSNGSEDVANAQSQMRDPRRRPQCGPQAMKQDDGFDAAKNVSRQIWMPNVNELAETGKNHSSQIQFGSGDHDDRQQQQFGVYQHQTLGGGRAMQRGVGDRIRGRGRLRRGF